MRDYRAGHKLGEKSDEAGVFKQGAGLHLAVKGVDDERYLLKGKEADAEGEQDMAQRPVGMEEAVYGAYEEVVIFEIEEHAEVERDGGVFGRAAALFARKAQRQAVKAEVYKHAGAQEHEIDGVIRAVEPQRHAKQI